MTAESVPCVSTRRQSFTVVLAIELWERFGFYGMQAVLALYLVGHLNLSDHDANLTIGAFSAMIYITPVLGGIVGDSLLGTRRSMVFGAIALALGYSILAIAASSAAQHYRVMLYFGMALIASGNGLFKPNAGNLVRRIYEGDDAALDAAFTIYYMSVNVGSTVAMLLTPWLQDRFNPSVAFSCCAGGLVLGLIYYAARSRHLLAIDAPLDRAPLDRRGFGIVAIGFAVSIFVVMALLDNASLARMAMAVAAVGIAAAWAVLYRRVHPYERPGMSLAYMLCLETMVFTVFYQQEVTSLTLLALRGVNGDFSVDGIEMFHLSAGQFQALNPLWIMIASPILAWLYTHMAKSGRDLGLAVKMAAGFAFVAMGFLIWWLMAAAARDLLSPWVMVVGYAFVSVAELLTMGLGLAVVARYVPPRFSGFMMGSLYLVWALAMYVGSVIANIATAPADVVAASHIGAALYVPLLRDLFWAALASFAVVTALLPLAAKWSRFHVN